MIKVLQVVDSMNLGGIQSFLMSIYRNLDYDKIQFHFLVHTEKECFYDSEIRALGGKIFNVPARNQGINKNRKALIKFFENNKNYQIVHMHESSLSYIEPLNIAKKFGVKTRIIHSHSTGFSKGNYIHKILHKFHQLNIIKISTHRFSCSDKASRWMYGTENGVTIIKNGIDLKKYNFNMKIREEYRKKFKIQNNIVIGHVGRFTYPKNHIFLLKIFKKLLSYNEKFILLLVGEGPLKKEIEQLSMKLNINNKVIFLGGRKDISKILQSMDIFLFPSLYEGLPLSLVEAQAAGLKCIVSDSVTKQVNLTNFYYDFSLEKSSLEWAKFILKNINYRRNCCIDILKNKGFDIIDTAVWLQKFYVKESEEKNERDEKNKVNK
ncbi:MAG: glycosyltransferase family 1 protein [Fusobacterium sp. JB019]|nr:glycosyltransferase family 1 protein [Fusobacterium sp. JB019]